jgi:hypothetical protein
MTYVDVDFVLGIRPHTYALGLGAVAGIVLESAD